MSPEVKNFLEENINLIEQRQWDEVYNKNFPTDFTKTLLDCGINPLEQGLNHIPNYFLFDCKNIKEFIIPDNVKSIGSHAFYNCSKLTSIEIPNSVTSIGMHAFFGCTSLKSITISNRVTSIGDYVFSCCSSLTSINYTGTKKEALTILRARNKKWRSGSLISKIICTDGVIEL